jgi:hypothetical protein
MNWNSTDASARDIDAAAETDNTHANSADCLPYLTRLHAFNGRLRSSNCRPTGLQISGHDVINDNQINAYFGSNFINTFSVSGTKQSVEVVALVAIDKR